MCFFKILCLTQLHSERLKFYKIAKSQLQNMVNDTWKSSLLPLQKWGNSECFVDIKDILTISWDGRNTINIGDGMLERLTLSLRDF